jgi:single-stranded DNA-binding protein
MPLGTATLFGYAFSFSQKAAGYGSFFLSRPATTDYERGDNESQWVYVTCRYPKDQPIDPDDLVDNTPVVVTGQLDLIKFGDSHDEQPHITNASVFLLDSSPVSVGYRSTLNIVSGACRAYNMEYKATANSELVNFRVQFKKGRDDVIYLNAVAWGKTAEIINKYVGHGHFISIDEAVLKFNTFVDKYNQRRVKPELTITSLSLLPNNKEEGNGSGNHDSGDGADNNLPVPPSLSGKRNQAPSVEQSEPNRMKVPKAPTMASNGHNSDEFDDIPF